MKKIFANVANLQKFRKEQESYENLVGLFI